MNKIKDIKFRASRIGELMTDGSGFITEKQTEMLNKLYQKEKLTAKQEEKVEALMYKRANPKLSDTTKGYVEDVFIKEKYGREDALANKYLDKGLYCEEDSITLLSDVRDKLYTKNEEELSNKYITGTPDIIEKDLVIDIKTSWSMKTFIKTKEVVNSYYWQLQAYMWLTGIHKAELIFCLVDAPEHMIVSEKTKRLYQTGYDDTSKEWMIEEDRIDKWMRFDDIEKDVRIKVFKVDFNQNDITKVMKRVEMSRDYLSNIKLNS